MIHVRTLSFSFTASQYNPDLKNWDIPMPAGDHRGCMSSQLLLLSIQKAGEYILKFEASSFQDYESCGLYQINVIKPDEDPRTLTGEMGAKLKDRYTDIDGKIMSVYTGKAISGI